MEEKKPRKGKLKTPAPELQELLDLTREIKLVFSSLGAAGTKTFTSLSNDIASLVTSAGDLDIGFENITKQINKLKSTGADAYSNIVNIGTAATESQKQMAIDSGNMFAKTYTVGLKAMEEGFNGLKNTIEDQAIEVSKFYGDQVLKELNTALDSMQPDEAFKKIGKSLVEAAKNAGAGEAVINDIETAVQHIKSTNLQTAKIVKEQYDTVQKIKKAEELRAETLKEINEETAEYKETYDKISGTIKSIWKDPKFNLAVFSGIGLSKLIGEADRLRETFGELRQDGQTIGQAFHSMGKSFNVLNTIIGVDTGKAIDGLEDAIGDMQEVTSDMGSDVAFMGKQYGMSENEAGKLVGTIAKLSGFTADATIESTKYAGNLAVAAHVAPGRVMEQIANNSEEFAKYSSTSSKNLFTAAVAAVKMGVEFKTLTSAADHLLDFEESINDQMEASVLLGKELNFDRARELANRGDVLGANKEILKQLGSEAEFNQMSVLQKKALAQATGYSIQDLSTMIKNQGKLNELTHEQVDALNNGSKITDVLAMGAENMMNKFDPKNIIFILSGLASMKHLLNGTAIATKLNTAATLVWKAVVWATSGIFGGLKKSILSLLPGIKDVTNSLGGLKTKAMDALGGTKLGKSFKENVVDKIKGKAQETTEGVGSKVIDAAKGKAQEKVEDATETAGSKVIDKVKGKGEEKIEGLTDKITDKVTGKSTKPEVPEESPIEKTAGGMSKINWTSVLKGAAALLIVSGAMFVFAKALQEFKDVSMVEIAKGMLTLVASLIVFGVAAQILEPLAPAMLLLGGALLFVGGAIALMGNGFKAISEGITNITKNIDSMMLLGPALLSVAAGLTAMAASGFLAMPIIGALAGLALVAPALRSIAGIFGSGEHETHNNKEEKADNTSGMEVVKRLDRLIKLVEAGHDINIDGKKLGSYLALAAPRQQITNLKPL